MVDKPEHKKAEESSVEQNLAQDYVPKGKLGNLPVSNQISDALQKQMDRTKEDIEKFKKELMKKFKYVEAMGIVPAQASAKIEEEYEVPEEDVKRKLIHLLILIPEANFKEIGKVRLEAISLAKSINDKLWCHIMTPIDIWNLCLDSKFDIVEALAMSFPILDNGLLGALRVSEIHKALGLKKFEKYVTSYVIAGSLVRGEATATSDVDVAVIIDDTDVKRMPRLELKEKLRSIIAGAHWQEATAIAGVKNILNVQVWLLTDFWERVKDAEPIAFTFLRDGVPLFDKGTFLPWKSLLRMGKIKPSPEAIDMFMSTGDKMDEVVKRRLLDILMIDIYWGVIQPTQGLLMLYGQSPGTVYDTVKEFKEIFLDKEKLVEKKYVDILNEILIKYYKGYEHGKIKEVSGAEIDRLVKDAIDYNKRLKELRKHIEKRVQEKSMAQVYKDVFGMLEAILKKKSEAAIIKAFDEQLVQKGRFPHRFLEGLKFIVKIKKDLEKPEPKKKKKAEKDVMTGKEVRNVDRARKVAAEIVNELIEYNQRCDIASMSKSKFVVKGKKGVAEVFFLGNVFVIEGQKISKLENGKLTSTTIEDLQKQLTDQGDKEVKIDPKAIVQLKKIFGDFELVH